MLKKKCRRSICPKIGSGWFMNWNFGMAFKAVKNGFLRYAVRK